MHALITGGQGYIGYHLANALLSRGHTVTTLDSGFNSTIAASFQSGGRLVRHQATVVNPDAVGRAMQGVDIVYHLAARFDWDKSPRHPLRLVEANVLGTATVLAMAHKMGIDRVIFTSSADVYGNIVGARPTDPCVPVNMLGATKLAAEALCRGYYQQGLEVVILRLYNVWGKVGSHSVIDEFMHGCETINGDGMQTRDFVYIDDVIKALLLSADWDSNVYNIATGEETTINGIWALMHPNTWQPTYNLDYNPGYQELQRSCGDITGTPWKPEVFLSNLDGDGIRQHCLAS